jgi:hypothetical protein
MRPPLPAGTTWPENGRQYRIARWRNRNWRAGENGRSRRQTCSEWAEARKAHDPREIERIRTLVQAGGKP